MIIVPERYFCVGKNKTNVLFAEFLEVLNFIILNIGPQENSVGGLATSACFPQT